MNIYYASAYLKQGCCIRRPSWGLKFISISLEDSVFHPSIFLTWNDAKGTVHAGVDFGVDDIAADDWEIYTPTHKDLQR